MRFRRIVSAAFVALLVVVFGLPAQASQVRGQAAPGELRQVGPITRSVNGQPAVAGEVVVRFAASSSAAERQDVRASLDATRSQSLGVEGLQLLKLNGGDVQSAIADLEQRSDVIYAEPNYIYEMAGVPNDLEFDKLWGMNNSGQTVNGVAGTPDADIDAVEAWDTTTGSSNVVVAVVDTGIAYDHPDLAPNMWSNPGETPGNGRDDDGNGFTDDTRGWDFVAGDKDPFDLNLHGSHVAGTIGAEGDNTAGVAGVNWEVSLMALRVLDDAGAGTNAAITAAFNYAGDNGADVVNASLGGGGFSQGMLNAIKGAPNTLFVVAAGNEGSNNNTTPVFPCNYTAANNICVAATNSKDALASFSNRGATHVDLAAPGTSILSSLPNFESQFTETFSDGAGWTTRWTTGGTKNSWGLQGTKLADSPNANYLNNTDSFVRKTTGMNLTGMRGCRADYLLHLNTEFQFDFLWIDWSTNGTTFIEDSGWTGSTGGNFFEFSTPLGTLDNQAQAHFGFRLESDGEITKPGAVLDNIDLQCIEPGSDGDEYGFLDGTSMATPHVAGAAALLLADDPTATVANLRSALLRGVDAKASLTNRVATGGRLNLKKSLDCLAGGDCDPPNTTITQGPSGRIKKKNAATLKFKFSSDEAGSTFKCKRNNGSWASCTSPKVYRNLPLGEHTFRVRATDQAGNTDPTPAKRVFKIVRN
jgi:subtilisin family serine protease